MAKRLFIILVSIYIIFGSISLLFGWGVWGHNRINRCAVMALPTEMGMFFYNHIDFLTEESVVPDLRKYTINDKAEGIRHYIDLEGFKTDKIADFPRTLNDANSKYSSDTVKKYGILPWYIGDMMEKLTTAFKNKNKAEILFLAGDLGHYIGDAHMPLHTSLNHDGQYTNQKGIHGFWESHLPEQFGKEFKLYTGTAHYIDNISENTWKIIEHSHSLVDSLLTTDQKLKAGKKDENIYVVDETGKIKKNKYGQPIHTADYAMAYHQMLNGMVERQLKGAIDATADYWFTAWVNAGKPDLSGLDDANITKRNKKFYKKDIHSWKNGVCPNVNTVNEY